jgi:glycosyltransferase involved in cell wall biosynthesis
MKILFLMHDDYAAGGIQRSTLAARECLVATGHEVGILCVKLVADGGHAERLPFVRAVTAQHGSRLVFWSRFVRDLRALLRREAPDVLIGMGLAPSVLARLASAGLPGLRCVGSERASPPDTPVGAVWTLLRRLTFPALDAIVCQTSRTAHWYRKALGIRPDRLRVIGNVVARPGIEPAPVPASLKQGGDGLRVACVGRFHPQKGLDMAVETFALVARNEPKARLLIVGEGELKAGLEQQARHLGIGDRVDFHPPLRPLAPLWAVADLFLLTSRYEGIPNVLAEAMAHGSACVSFDCPTGPAEMIEDGVNGFLIPLGDCRAAAARCTQLLADPDLRARLGKEARRLPERYSVERIGEAWNSLMTDLQRSPPRSLPAGQGA